MATLLLHFAAGTLGCLIVFLVFVRLSGSRSFSAPFGIIFIGIACAVMAHFVSPWATPVIVAIYVFVSAVEFARERKARKSEVSQKES